MTMWTKSITAHGLTATPEQLNAAWTAWTKRPPLTARRLEVQLAERLGASCEASLAAMRIADRMLQQARKRATVIYRDKHWHLASSAAEENAADLNPSP